jgi:hypothetical protein
LRGLPFLSIRELLPLRPNVCFIATGPSAH